MGLDVEGKAWGRTDAEQRVLLLHVRKEQQVTQHRMQLDLRRRNYSII